MKVRLLLLATALAFAGAFADGIGAQTLNVVTAGDQNMVDYVNNYLAPKFEAMNPGVKVRAVGTGPGDSGSQKIYEKLSAQQKANVAEWDVDVELVTKSPEQYWEMISEHVSLAVAALQQVDAPARERVRATAIAKVSAFEKDGKVRVPGVARCIVGTK